MLGAYRVEGTIGAGSMGEVFKGIDTGLNRRVAIKILSEKHRDTPELRARFVREGRAVAAISHPNVVPGVRDRHLRRAAVHRDGAARRHRPRKRRREGRPARLAIAAHAVLDAAQGLAAAAKAGLIHRDVKPSNLVRLSNGRVKVTDFGLAKPVDPGSEPALTAMGVVVGTPDYIAPEQARGETIDERVDIYALGGTLYFLLTGIPPFRTGKPAEDKYLKVVARHLRNPPPDATVANPRADNASSPSSRAQMMAKKPARAAVVRRSRAAADRDPDAARSGGGARARRRVARSLAPEHGAELPPGRVVGRHRDARRFGGRRGAVGGRREARAAGVADRVHRAVRVRVRRGAGRVSARGGRRRRRWRQQR